MKICGSKYRNRNDDFEVMMKTEKYKNALFLFNDNEREHGTNIKGAGNAVMRKYSKLDIPRSFGIPTGIYRTGYTQLDNKTKDAIDSIFYELKNLVDSGNYNTLVYSIEDEFNPLLGTSIFQVSQDVLIYITRKILSLGEIYTTSNNSEVSVEINDEFIGMVN